MEKVNVAVIGATGIVGQVFMWMLSDHRWFRPVYVSASSSRCGSIYGNEIKWQLPFPMPDTIRNFQLHDIDPERMKKCGVEIVFSALPAGVAKKIEPQLRDHGFYVFSNAGAMRRESDVPILIPEINIHALDLIKKQGYPGNGFVVTNANCTVTGLSMVLAPLKPFGIQEVVVSTYQAISGAGYPGLSALDIQGNTIPYIQNEEEKLVFELGKILEIDADVFPYCVRVPTLFGHLESVWISFDERIKESALRDAWHNFRFKGPRLPSMPVHPVKYSERADFPQAKISFFGTPPGMVTYTGRLKKVKTRFGFILLSNNLVKGAAGGSIQNAEAFLILYHRKT